MKIRSGLVGLFVMFSALPSPVAAQMPTLHEPWQPPLGIPAPSFGIVEQAGTPNFYVDNTNPSATDASNPNGTPTRPRATVPTYFPAGAVVEVRGGPYPIGSIAWFAAGTAASPVFIKGVNMPVFTGTTGSQLAAAGSYMIIEGITMEHLPLVMSPTINHFAFRKSILRYHSPGVNSAAIAPAGSDVVFYGNEVNNNGDATSATEIDVHGFKPLTGANRVWIVDNHIHHNGGDGIQVSDAASAEPWPQSIYIARNVIHEDRENAVDIKQARDVIVSQNVMYGYRPTSSSGGEVVVTHDGSQRVWVVGNVVAASSQGIVCTGADQYYVVGNLIFNIAHVPGDPNYDPNSTFRTAGILTYGTTNSSHVNNTLANVDSGISYPSGTAPTRIVNNIITNLLQPTFHIAIGNSTAFASSTMSYNLLGSPAILKISGGVSGCGSYPHCMTGDPMYADIANSSFDLKPGSPAIDAGIADSVYSTFQSWYGIALSTDLKGAPRPYGSAYDLGALEFAGAPAPPKNLRIIR